MDKAFVRLLKGLALVGLALSFSALVLMVAIRVEEVSRMPVTPGFPGPANALRHILDGMKEAGVTFLLAGLLYVGCVVAQNLTRPRRPDDDPD
jgi:hypothetical protein